MTKPGARLNEHDQSAGANEPPSTAHAPGDGRRGRILNVAERLFAERGYSNVSVRDIAAEAGVTHPLIYYHWGSKEGLLAATVARSQGRVRARLEAAGAVDAAVIAADETLRHNRLYVLTLTRALLDGMPPSSWPGGFPGIEAALAMLLDEARADGEDETGARLRLACVVAMLDGWVLIEDQLLEMVGLSADDRERGRVELLAAIRKVLARGPEEA
jgi:AcrR family transcriptional regulator